MSESVRRLVAFAALAVGFALLVNLLAGSHDDTGQQHAKQLKEYTQSLPSAGTTLAPKPSCENQDKAVLRIPVLGRHYVEPIVAGVTESVLDSGSLGRFPESTTPGGIGNYSLTGHRVTHGEPFRFLTMVEPGDKVYVDCAGYRFVYTITRKFVVDYHQVRVLDSHGERRLITLITCDSYTQHTDNRFVLRGELSSAKTLH